MKQGRTGSKGFPFQPNHTRLKPAQVPAAACEHQRDWRGTVRARFVTTIDFLNEKYNHYSTEKSHFKCFHLTTCVTPLGKFVSDLKIIS